jgi:uncharacterized protein (DUF952 family)
MRIYKVLRAAEWQALQGAGETQGSPADQADGFVHFSTVDQVPGTLERHFAGVSGLWLLTCEAEGFGAALAWEPSRGGALFPHLYGPLRLADVVLAEPLPLIGGEHQVPLLE